MPRRDTHLWRNVAVPGCATTPGGTHVKVEQLIRIDRAQRGIERGALPRLSMARSWLAPAPPARSAWRELGENVAERCDVEDALFDDGSLVDPPWT